MRAWPGRRALEAASRSDAFAVFCDRGASSLRVRGRVRWPVWPALLFSFAWFYWRRLYLVGSLMVMPPVLMADLGAGAVLPFGLGPGLIVVLLVLPPFLARRIYGMAFLQRQARAERAGLSEAERFAYLRAAGGTSWLAALLAGASWLSFVIALVHGFFPHGRAALSR